MLSDTDIQEYPHGILINNNFVLVVSWNIILKKYLETFLATNWELELNTRFLEIKKEIILFLRNRLPKKKIILEENIPPYPMSICNFDFSVYYETEDVQSIPCYKQIGTIYFNNGKFIYTPLNVDDKNDTETNTEDGTSSESEDDY